MHLTFQVEILGLFAVFNKFVSLSRLYWYQLNGFSFYSQGFLQKDKKYSVARIFPYGGYKIKAAEQQDVDSLKEAEKIALESLPDETMKVKNMDELQLYVRRAYSAKPLKMPVLLVTGKSSIFLFFISRYQIKTEFHHRLKNKSSRSSNNICLSENK